MDKHLPVHRAAVSPRKTREVENDRIFIFSFAAGLAIIIVALTLIRLLPLPDSAITIPQKRWVQAAMPGDEIMALKLRHTLTEPRYDIGLFGNSRIMMVGADELRLPDQRIFNFSIGGSSVRQSIRFLDALLAHGRAPATAVISMDNVELGLPSIGGGFPLFPIRWLAATNDILIAWRHEGARSGIVEAINWAATESRVFAITFSHNFVRTKIRAMLDADEAPSGFRSDGSLEQTIPKTPVIAPLPKRADTYPQLEDDFRRLAEIRDSGIRIVVYESPIAPELGDSTNDELSPNARQVRHRFWITCARLRLECYGPPRLRELPWFDRDHAPAEPLAAWLRKILQ